MRILLVPLVIVLAVSTSLLAASAAAPAEPPPPGTVLGIDVASGQHDGGATIDWNQVAEAGYRFAFVKATEGSYYDNPFLASDLAGARAAGLLVAAYHFANPSFSGGALQADFAVDHAGSGRDGGTLPLIADLEFDPYAAQDHTNECYGLTQARMMSWIRTFSAEVHRRTGQEPVIYTVASWWNACTGRSKPPAGDPLWVASYDPGTTGPTMPVGWPAWAYWQYTSTGKVPGIHGSTDLSELNPAALEVAAPADRTDPAGTTVDVPIRSVNAAAGQLLSYSATGLPLGLAIDPVSGAITGTLPAAPASVPVTVTISGTGLTPVLQSFRWNVIGPVRLPRSSARSGLVGGPVFLQLPASDGVRGCTLRFAAAGLPPGLAIGPCGLVSGWLTQAGTYHAVITVAGSDGATLGTTTLAWQVRQPPVSGPAGELRQFGTSSCLVSRGGGLRLAGCARARQRWTLTAGGSVRQSGSCLAVLREGQVQARPCRGTIFQQWRPGTGGTMRNGRTGACLTAGARRHNSPLRVTSCGGASGQQWVIPAAPLVSGVAGWCASGWHPAGVAAGLGEPASVRQRPGDDLDPVAGRHAPQRGPVPGGDRWLRRGGPAGGLPGHGRAAVAGQRRSGGQRADQPGARPVPG